MQLASFFDLDPWIFFRSLFNSQPAPYSAYVDGPRFKICSVSPELFFKKSGNKIIAKPMKGTAQRGLNAQLDNIAKETLFQSDKNRAENLMIVDMIRNDLGKIADTGSVEVKTLFDVETYPTVLQMTSEVTAETQLSAAEIIRNIFPSASITGAPKINTMGVIIDTESEARGIYTGSIGFMTPNGDSQFNVAIRTALVDTQSKNVSYGVGSGVTWYSEADSEYSECLLKANVLSLDKKDFDIITSLCVDRGKVYFFEQHVQRLLDSAEYFQIPLQREELVRVFDIYLSKNEWNQTFKVKISIDTHGQIVISRSNWKSFVSKRVEVSRLQTNTMSAFIFNKTSYRDQYQTALSHHSEADDVIMVNQFGYVTESTTANVVVEKGNKLYTPKLSDGLLNGVFRQQLLQANTVTESSIAIEDVQSATALYLVNSVRGWMRLVKCSKHSWAVESERCYELEKPID